MPTLFLCSCISTEYVTKFLPKLELQSYRTRLLLSWRYNTKQYYISPLVLYRHAYLIKRVLHSKQVRKRKLLETYGLKMCIFSVKLSI